MQSTVHNPDRYMADLRQILSQGRKRIGLLLGAGAPTALRVDPEGRISSTGKPLIPDVAGLTEAAITALTEQDKTIVDLIKEGLSGNPNIEAILTQVRKLAQAIGKSSVHGLDGPGYEGLGQRICDQIGTIVGASLPKGPNSYTELVSWIAGTYRLHAIEIFTPNYDLLLEQAFERARIPYFDGFTGARRPFFDPVSISSCEQLPARWTRLWKLHGSLGWELDQDTVVRTDHSTATKLIYPDHLKYDQVSRLPYSALFERLRVFLTTPDSLLICSGFSFFDSHICAVLDESLAANNHTAILAFQYRRLDEEALACRLAVNRPNMSVYARDGAVVSGISGPWQPGEAPNDEWAEIRQTFWQSTLQDQPAQFVLGDFAKLSRFFALAQAQQILPIAMAGQPLTGPSEASNA
jgi:hypothetical protein